MSSDRMSSTWGVVTLVAVTALVLAVVSVPAFAGKGNANRDSAGKSATESTLTSTCNPCVAGEEVLFSGTGYHADRGDALLDIGGTPGIVGVAPDGSISFSWTFADAGEYVVEVHQQRNKKHLDLKASATVVVEAADASAEEPPVEEPPVEEPPVEEPPAEEPPTNNPPIAQDDTASTEGTAVQIDVLVNDSDPDANLDPSSLSVSCEACAPAGAGSTAVGEDGRVVYTPDAGFVGVDSFTYQVCDLGSLCATANVSVDVTEPFVEPPYDPGSGTGEGRVRLTVNAKSAFDVWTQNPSTAEQEAMRALYDLMIVRAPYFDSRLDWFPEAIAYIDLYAIYTDPDRDSRAQTNPEWVLRDGNGDLLYIDWGCSGGSCPQYAGDVGDPAFRSDFVQRVGALVEAGYRGVMIDDVNMSWRISDGNGDRVIPIDPRTGQEMTLSDWRRYVAELTELVRSTFPTIAIMHNSIWYSDTPNFSDPHINRQIAAADWIMLERGVNDGGLVGGFDSKWSIHTLFEYVDSVHSQGTGVLYLDEDASTAAEQEYNLAAYLLTSNGRDLVSTEDYPMIAPDSVWAGFTVNLGDALTARYQWNGVTRRDFTGGMVLLADPDTPARTITLPKPYVTLDGQTVTSVTLSSSTGVVLRDG